MDVSILLFVVLLFLSLPTAFVLKICMKAHDENAISRFFKRKGIRRLNGFFGYILFFLSMIGVVFNIYMVAKVYYLQQTEIFSLGMILILAFPVVSLWLGRLTQRVGKEGCGAL